MHTDLRGKPMLQLLLVLLPLQILPLLLLPSSDFDGINSYNPRHEIGSLRTTIYSKLVAQAVIAATCVQEMPGSTREGSPIFCF
jgi:hypothetical protein